MITLATPGRTVHLLKLKTKDSKKRSIPKKYRVDYSSILNIGVETEGQGEKDELNQNIFPSGMKRIENTRMGNASEFEEDKHNQ